MTKFIENNAGDSLHFIKEICNNLNLRTDKSFIAGGSIKSFEYERNDHDDIDIFVVNEIEFVRLFNLLSIDDNFNEPIYSKHAVTFPSENNDYKIQLIKEFYKTPLEIISEFDFSIIRAYYDNEQDVIIASSNYHNDNSDRLLRIEYFKNLKNFLYRLHKYIRKGYDIDHYHLLQISEVFHKQIKLFDIDIDIVNTIELCKEYNSWDEFIHLMEATDVVY